MDEERMFYEDLHAGYAAGQAWARKQATPAELARLAVRAADVQRPADPVSIFKALGKTSRWRSVQEFWAVAIGEGFEDLMDNTDYLEGWLQGATSDQREGGPKKGK
jgi:hypothetical protein